MHLYVALGSHELLHNDNAEMQAFLQIQLLVNSIACLEAQAVRLLRFS